MSLPIESRPELPPEPPDEKPPLFSTWPRLYGAILSYVALVILLFYVFTQYYRLTP